MMLKIKASRLWLLSMAMALPLGATGLRSFELSARAASLGGAFVARADDVSAVYYNPAGLAFLPGLRLKVNIQNYSQALNARQTAGDNEWSIRMRPVRTSAFLSYAFKNRISLGLGAFPAYALDIGWPNYWDYNVSVCRNNFYAFALRGILAVRLLDSLSLGFGLDFLDVHHDWTWSTRVPVGTYPFYLGMDSTAGLKGSGLSFNAGLLFAPSKKLRFGMRYQRGITLNLEGEHFQVGVGVQRAWMSVRLPDELTAGFQVRPLPRLALHMDVQWIDWSRTSPWTLVLGEQVSGMWGAVLEEGEKAVPSEWRDTLSFLYGAEYALSSVLFLRAGFSRLAAAVSADNLHPFAPDLEDDAFTLGAGYEGPFFSITSAERLGDMSVDVFVQYHHFRNEVSGLAGFPLAYSARRWAVGVGIGFIY